MSPEILAFKLIDNANISGEVLVFTGINNESGETLYEDMKKNYLRNI